MGWETRGGKARFYTRSKRVDGRVVREYVGTAAEAQAVAERDDLERRKRRRDLEERARLLELDAMIDNYCRQIRAIVESTLNSAGYHRHMRSEWRRNKNHANDK